MRTIMDKLTVEPANFRLCCLVNVLLPGIEDVTGCLISLVIKSLISTRLLLEEGGHVGMESKRVLHIKIRLVEEQ